MKSITILAAFFILSLAPVLTRAQATSCSDVRNGVFVYFSFADGSRCTYTRNGETQKEFNPTTHETITWDVEWMGDCAYYLKYNSGFEDKPKQAQEVLKKHKFLYQVVTVTKDYYIYQSTLDYASNPVISKDTLWIKQQSDAKRKVTINPRLDSLLALRKAAFDLEVGDQHSFMFSGREDSPKAS